MMSIFARLSRRRRKDRCPKYLDMDAKERVPLWQLQSNGDEEPDKVRQLWSYNSSSGGSYVYMTTISSGDEEFVVASNGEDDASTLNITLEVDKRQNRQDDEHFTEPYLLKFSFDGKTYYINASMNGVTASAGTNAAATATAFVLVPVIDQSCYVLPSIDVKDGDKELYLSSNGAGNMKLKVWNAPVPPPPETTVEVDPALLFRLVRPLGAK